MQLSLDTVENVRQHEDYKSDDFFGQMEYVNVMIVFDIEFASAASDE